MLKFEYHNQILCTNDFPAYKMCDCISGKATFDKSPYHTTNLKEKWVGRNYNIVNVINYNYIWFTERRTSRLPPSWSVTKSFATRDLNQVCTNLKISNERFSKEQTNTSFIREVASTLPYNLLRCLQIRQTYCMAPLSSRTTSKRSDNSTLSASASL